MFSRLNITHNLPLNPAGDLLYRFGEEVDGEFQGICYLGVDTATQTRLMDFLPKEIQHKFFASLMVINRPEIPAHTDNEILVTINFYVQTAEALTRFHEFKSETELAVIKLDNQSDGAIYAPECLNTVGEFQARAGEVWILDVKKPHSVSCGTTDIRIAYCLQSTILNYEDVIKHYA